jgi:hypothetical protein
MPVERSARPCKEPRQSLSSALAAENTKAAKPGGQQHQHGWLGHRGKVEIRAEGGWVKGSSSSVSSRGPAQAVGGNTANVCDRGVGRQPGNYGVHRRRIGADVLGDEVGRPGRKRDRGYRLRVEQNGRSFLRISVGDRRAGEHVPAASQRRTAPSPVGSKASSATTVTALLVVNDQAAETSPPSVPPAIPAPVNSNIGSRRPDQRPRSPTSQPQ